MLFCPVCHCRRVACGVCRSLVDRWFFNGTANAEKRKYCGGMMPYRGTFTSCTRYPPRRTLRSSIVSRLSCVVSMFSVTRGLHSKEHPRRTHTAPTR